jgi:hypothetical protein
MPAPQNEPDVIRALRDYRTALDAQDEFLMRDMARRWMEVERSLQVDMLELAREMERRRNAGEVITEQIIWRDKRYKYLKAQMDAQVRRFNGDAVGIISNSQRQTATLGINAAQAAIFAQTGPFGVAWNRINIGAVEALIGFAGDGSPLNMLLRKDYPDAVNGLIRALTNGLARGYNSARIAQDMSNGMGMGLDRALLIARTEVARAYRTASTEQYRQSGVVNGFMRLVKKATACMACLMLDGQKFDLASELDDHPRGKCNVIPLVAGVADPQWQKGPEYFRNLSPEEQRARMGEERFELWKSGAFQLDDLAKMSHSSVWGDAPRVATLAELQP